VFEKESQGYISGKGSANLAKVLFGIKGGDALSQGWLVKDARVVNYMSAHDNNTLWDKLELSNGSYPIETRLAMNRLGATILMASKGMTFFQAGEEMLRTKDGDENSYKSSDEINNIDWSVLDGESIQYKMMLYYKHLIDVRKTYSIFTNNSSTITEAKTTNGRVAVLFEDELDGKALLISNPTSADMTYELDGTWYMVVNGVDASAEPVLCEGSITVPAYSAIILVNG
jgi:pullulanase